MTATTPEHTISSLCQRSRDISLEKGWLNPDGTDPRPRVTVFLLFVSELSEAFEDFRANRRPEEVYYEDAVKPCGIPIELADFVIRVCQYVGSRGLGPALETSFEDELGTEVNMDLETVLASAIAWVQEFAGADSDDEDQERVDSLSALANGLAVVFSYAEVAKIDLWAAIDEKEAYNRTRPTRHGGKVC